MNDTLMEHRDRVLADMRAVMSDAEELLRASAGEATEGTRALRERLQGSLSHARDGLVHLQETAGKNLRAAGHAADDYVHENPWRSIAVGAGAGLLIGMLIGRR